jgi:hypothetical protein
MLSVACLEPPPPASAESGTVAPAPRRLSVTAVMNARKPGKSQRGDVPEQTIKIPRYSRITYRAGTVTVR